jgi:flavodoxin
MPTKVYYSTRTGNTKLIADAIADALNCSSENIKNAKIPDNADDVYFGAAVYADYQHKHRPEVRDFIHELKEKGVKNVKVFDTYAFGSSINLLIQLFNDEGIAVSDEHFSCKGRFAIFNRNRPHAQDIEAAKVFAMTSSGKGK